MFVVVAGEAKRIVVTSVGNMPGKRHIAKPKKNIGRQKKEKDPTAVKKEAEENAILQKTWMIHLQHLIIPMILSL